MAGEKRTKAQRLADREKIAGLLLKSWTAPMIARELKLSEATVNREKRILVDEWKKAAADDIDAVKAKELQKLDDLEREARAEWERSKLAYQKKVVEDLIGRGGETGRAKKAKIETIEQLGDPRYLTIIQGCMDRRAKILGTDAPTKVAPTTPDGKEPYKPMTDAELDARILELSRKVGADGAAAHGSG